MAESIALLISVVWHSFNSRWIVGWGIKFYLGAAEGIAMLISVLWYCFYSRWIVGVGIKRYSGPAEIASISCRDLSRRNRQDFFWFFVSARYWYILFLWAIAVSHLVPLDIDKYLRAESIALLIFVLWHCFYSRWIVGWGIKSCLGPAEIASFCCRDLSRHNKHDLFWLVVSATCLCFLFLWAIVVSDFLPLEIHKHLRGESIALLIFVLWHCFISRWIVGCCIKSNLRAAETIALLIFVLWRWFNNRCIVRWGIKSYLEPAETASSSCRDLSRRNKHDLFWLVVSARSLHLLFLWAIVFSDFLFF